MSRSTICARGQAVEIMRDPKGPWIAARYSHRDKSYERWHWVTVAFGEQVLVPARRLRSPAQSRIAASGRGVVRDDAAARSHRPLWLRAQLDELAAQCDRTAGAADRHQTETIAAYTHVADEIRRILAGKVVR